MKKLITSLIAVYFLAAADISSQNLDRHGCDFTDEARKRQFIYSEIRRILNNYDYSAISVSSAVKTKSLIPVNNI